MILYISNDIYLKIELTAIEVLIMVSVSLCFMNFCQRSSFKARIQARLPECLRETETSAFRPGSCQCLW